MAPDSLSHKNKKNMNVQELTANSKICDFTDEQIRAAMDSIKGDSPLYFAIELVSAMNRFIVNNDDISEPIKNSYYALYLNLEFYMNLVKMSINYKS